MKRYALAKISQPQDLDVAGVTSRPGGATSSSSSGDTESL